jgi:hypothetical protein
VAEIVPILITPCTHTTKGAVPVLKDVHFWHLNAFRAWMKNALQAIRHIRRDFQGPGNLEWRISAADRFIAEKIAPAELKKMLVATAADCMEVVKAKEEDGVD